MLLERSLMNGGPGSEYQSLEEESIRYYFVIVNNEDRAWVLSQSPERGSAARRSFSVRKVRIDAISSSCYAEPGQKTAEGLHMHEPLYLSIDAESDGLYGEAFAIGAAVLSSKGEVMAAFSGKAEENRVQSAWVRENSLPHLSDLPVYDTRKQLREAFWAFYLQWRERCVILADVPYPVEVGLLRQCVAGDLQGREFLGPFPLIDLASVLYARGLDPLLDRMAFCGVQNRRHHPLDDAIASGLCLIKAMGMDARCVDG